MALFGGDAEPGAMAFRYVRDNLTVRPADLLVADELRDLQRAIPVG
ncbi:MAG: hypothetical protein M3Y73_05050 [Actinomycetota bacterium]|nr:hypothetical protein [Actinomycetota bacterium]